MSEAKLYLKLSGGDKNNNEVTSYFEFDFETEDFKKVSDPNLIPEGATILPATINDAAPTVIQQLLNLSH